MKKERSLVRNAADAEQVDLATEREGDEAERDTLALQAVLRSESGRRILYRVLDGLGLFRTVTWNLEPAVMGRVTAQRDAAAALENDCKSADYGAWELMLREAREREERKNG